ncbi:hypothetical protein B6S44_19455 [Bosea sp. Tri-44]|uniref:hypothetical protein n=1 Tax=Bosea sp. Tri-44 TaxID=1972137 RepID=UPI00100F086E|nr:hypothetical protein [Bosea sp. Tri-44]RXT52918.1 hypothetical protein B6S44_19455 [Bosea sp. Tri-44]
MDRIAHSSAVIIGGKRQFRSKDTEAGIPGTVVTATHLNAEQEEIVGFIESTTQAPNGAKLNQLAIGIRSQRLNYVLCTGPANAYAGTLNPVIASYADLIVGTELHFWIPATNTGDSTINLGPGLVYFRSPRGAVLLPGDLKQDTFTTAIWTGVAMQLTATAQVPEPDINWRAWPTANRNVGSGVTVIQLDAAEAGSSPTMTLGAGLTKFTATVPGWYMLFGSIVSASGAAFLGAGLRKNGSVNLTSQGGPQAAYTQGTVTVATLAKLAIGDYVEFYASAGGTDQIDGFSTTFSGSFLKAT